jgi:hypothetical protein
MLSAYNFGCILLNRRPLHSAGHYPLAIFFFDKGLSLLSKQLSTGYVATGRTNSIKFFL